LKKIFLLFVAALFLTCLCGCTIYVKTDTAASLTNTEGDGEIERQTETLVGDIVPEFQMLNLDSNMVDLRKTKGPYLLFITQIKCPTCEKVLPLIENLKGDGENIISIYRKDSKREILETYEKYELNPDLSTILSGIEDPERNTVIEDFDLTSVPTLLFVDESNIVQWIHQGDVTNAELRDMASQYMH